MFLLLLFLLPSSIPPLDSENDEVWKKTKRYLKSCGLHKKVSKKGRKCSIAEASEKRHKYFPIEDKSHDLTRYYKAREIDVLNANIDILFLSRALFPSLSVVHW